MASQAEQSLPAVAQTMTDVVVGKLLDKASSSSKRACCAPLSRCEPASGASTERRCCSHVAAAAACSERRTDGEDVGAPRHRLLRRARPSTRKSLSRMRRLCSACMSMWTRWALNGEVAITAPSAYPDSDKLAAGAMAQLPLHPRAAGRDCSGREGASRNPA